MESGMVPSEEETVGFIDVGTNSIHLLVVRFYGGTAGTSIFQDKESVRLGESLYRYGYFDKPTINKASLVVQRFATISRDMGADKLVAFATCAAREAYNGRELVRAVAPYVDLKIIPGTEEARLVGLGVFGTKGPEQRTIEIDIGGGSTEVVIAEGTNNLFLDSLGMGAVRYAYGLGIDCTRRVRDSDYDKMRKQVDVGSYYAVDSVREIGFEKAVGSSGTLMALADMCAARRGDGDSSYFTLAELRTMMNYVRAKDMTGRFTIPGLSRGRADIIVPGGAIAEELMTLFGIERIEISNRGLKQGMQIDHMVSRGYTMFDTRDAAVRGLARRCQYDQQHAEAVCSNALQIFDQAKALGLHTMGNRMRNLLANSAILHDIGELISYTNHHILSQAIIVNSEMVGFDMDELKYMGLIVRFHHKKFPGPKDSRLSGIPEEDAREIRQCAMFLKMADVLDRHRNATVRSVKLVMKRDAVCMILTSDGDPSMEIWRLEKMSEDFRKLFGLGLVVEASN